MGTRRRSYRLPLVPARDLNLTKHDILRHTFGYESFRPGQEGIVDTLLAGRNVLAMMPTGSGKSLCYQVPALVKGGLSIIVSPLVALMQDQVAALALGIDRVEGQRGLARPRQSCEDDQAVARQFKRDVFQVVLARALN